eukprot:1805740-Rhodomonas_salina.1
MAFRGVAGDKPAGFSGVGGWSRLLPPQPHQQTLQEPPPPGPTLPSHHDADSFPSTPHTPQTPRFPQTAPLLAPSQRLALFGCVDPSPAYGAGAALHGHHPAGQLPHNRPFCHVQCSHTASVATPALPYPLLTLRLAGPEHPGDRPPWRRQYPPPPPRPQHLDRRDD